MIICIDAGHGGNDSGAVGSKSEEKDIVLDISQRASKKLTENGHTVILTRNEDKTISLDERCSIANSEGADLFISIHANSSENLDASGIETFYYPTFEDGKQLATFIQDRIIARTHMNNRGVKTERFQVLRETSMTAVLVEVGFMSNISDEEKMLTDSYRALCSDAIYYGILDYIEILEDGKIDYKELYYKEHEKNTIYKDKLLKIQELAENI